MEGGKTPHTTARFAVPRSTLVTIVLVNMRQKRCGMQIGIGWKYTHESYRTSGFSFLRLESSTSVGRTRHS